MIKILGLDIATTTGYCVLYNEDLLDYGLIKLQSRVNAEIRNKTADVEEQKLILKKRRYKQLRSNIKSLITEYRPNIIAMESVYHGHNVKTTASLNQVRGVVLEAIPTNVRTISIGATAARSLVIPNNYKFNTKLPNFATQQNYPKESSGKLKAFNWVINEYNLPSFVYDKNNDISDAIVLAYWCYITYNKKHE